MLHFARHLRSNATEAERILWRHLRKRQLAGFKFRRQHQIKPFICDFVCLEAGVAIELDGSQHADQMRYDEKRDAFLRSNGFRVFRFWNPDVIFRTGSVLETIREALRDAKMDGRFDWSL
ncbi:Very-short-patch-repair endonuclease [Enhydrobacter aerosaccus]|uniref:Very-short-patch-repair endonuclease n=1 Tax=Enhydrobacter aerosaccus TaxID=225324 RepID=A0A1T4K116_9HYPH|nr:endonuclease domain-containing protein [Enhydrobacter aerosaccus]SJZ36049.1 Very-short-patch-repair endonuclease [Enhydrobacter aerosaccus]